MNQNMCHAIERVTIERGVDPRRFVLVAGGGAGGLHCGAVGRMLGVEFVYVPRLAGVFCAFGMLNSPVQHDYVRSYVTSLNGIEDNAVRQHFEQMAEGACDMLNREGFGKTDILLERSLDLRYRDQQWDIRIPLSDGLVQDDDGIRLLFEEKYEQLYAHRQPETPIEVVKLRLTGIGVLPPHFPEPQERATEDLEFLEIRSLYLDDEVEERKVPVYSGSVMKAGHQVPGPCIVEEATTTILVGPGDRP